MVTTAKAGQVFTDGHGQEITVGPPCDIKDNGYWYCITHKVGLANNFDKDSHISRGRHVLAWMCMVCGTCEQP